MIVIDYIYCTLTLILIDYIYRTLTFLHEFVVVFLHSRILKLNFGCSFAQSVVLLKVWFYSESVVVMSIPI